MAVGPLGDLAFLPAEPSLADLPSESSSAADAPQALDAGRAAHVFWSDAAAAQPQQPPPPAPPVAARLKRSLAASPFAGAASKRPFRRRADGGDPPPEEPLLKEEAEPPPAAPLPSEGGLTTENVRQRLPAIPTVVTTSTYMQISISPTVWRAQEAGCPRGEGPLMLAPGLQAVQLEGQHDLQLYLYSSMNPRIITTGIPQAAGSGEAGEAREGTPAGDAAAGDGSGSGSGRTRHGAAYHSSGGAPAAPRRERASLALEEVFLVRKDPQRRIPDEVFHAAGPFEAGAALRMPAWPGEIWRFDICCRVSPPPGAAEAEPIWVKALNRPLQ